MATALAQRLGQSQPVEFGHAHVDQGQIERAIRRTGGHQDVERFPAVRGLRDLHAPRVEHVLDDRAVGVVVVHHQHAEGRHVGLFQHGHVGLGVAHANRDAEHELRADAGRTVHLDRAAHQLDQLLGNGQAQAGAAVAPRHARVGLHKGAEQPGQHFLRDADAGVAHHELELDLGAGRIGAVLADGAADVDHDLAVLGELDGVGHQVGEDLPQTQRVAVDDGRQAGLLAEAELKAFLVRSGGHQLQRVFDEGAQHEVAGGQFELARFDLGEVQDVVDDLQQALAGPVDRLSETPLLVVQRGAEQQLRHAQDAVHRRADLMAHVGHELALGEAGGFGQIAGALQLQRLVVVLGHVRHQAIQAQLTIGQAAGTGAMAQPPHALAWNHQAQQGVGGLVPGFACFLVGQQGLVIGHDHAA